MSSQLAATQKTPAQAGTAQRQPPVKSLLVSSRLECEQDLHERDT